MAIGEAAKLVTADKAAEARSAARPSEAKTCRAMERRFMAVSLYSSVEPSLKYLAAALFALQRGDRRALSECQ